LKARRIEDSCGETALMVAAQRQNLWAVKRLLKAGADARTVTPRKQTAVYFAVHPRASPETAKIVRELVVAGCPLLGSELHFPVYRRDVEITKLLLESGCPANTLFDQRESIGPDKGQTALTIAVDKNTVDEFPRNSGMTSTLEARLKIIQHLLKAGSDPNLANARGRTPLMLAVLEDAVKFAKVLLDAGADPHFVPRRSKMKSAAALAENRNLKEILSLFENSSRRRRFTSARTTD
jgi:ankyrin repeat protein